MRKVYRTPSRSEYFGFIGAPSFQSEAITDKKLASVSKYHYLCEKVCFEHVIKGASATVSLEGKTKPL